MISHTKPSSDMTRVKREVIRKIFSVARGSTKAMMLFGSVARGESGEKSDVDILQVVDQAFPSYKYRNINFSVYSFSTLEKIAREGSLFVRHLLEEGIILRDDDGRLANVFDQYIEPRTYAEFLQTLRTAAGLLDVTHKFYKTKWQRLNSLALYILRSGLYMKCAEAGHPLFSMPSVATKYDDPRIAAVYNLKRDKSPHWEGFLEARGLIEKYLTCKIHNPYKSVQDFMTANHKKPMVVALGLRLLKGDGDSDAYEAIKSESGADK